MSDEEKSELSHAVTTLENDVNFFKRWWPAVIVIGGLISFAFTAGAWWFRYDSNTVKKADLKELATKADIDSIRHQLASMSEGMHRDKAAEDSAGRVMKHEADSNRQNIAALKKMLGSFYTETRDERGRTVLHPYNPSN